MKIGRLLVSLVGLLAMILAYIYSNLYLLAIAVVAFVVGLYMMGANRRPNERRPESRASGEGSKKREPSDKKKSTSAN